MCDTRAKDAHSDEQTSLRKVLQMKGVKVKFFKDIFQLFKDLNKNKKGWRSFDRTWNID
jgi:hypothetical protein